MAKDELAKQKPKSVVSAPSTQVTIAFPFSNIQTRANPEEVRELAALVAELSGHVAKLRPSPETDALVERAQELTTKLGQ
jgi:hypothetical protein